MANEKMQEGDTTTDNNEQLPTWETTSSVVTSEEMKREQPIRYIPIDKVGETVAALINERMDVPVLLEKRGDNDLGSITITMTLDTKTIKFEVEAPKNEFQQAMLEKLNEEVEGKGFDKHVDLKSLSATFRTIKEEEISKPKDERLLSGSRFQTLISGFHTEQEIRRAEQDEATVNEKKAA